MPAFGSIQPRHRQGLPVLYYFATNESLSCNPTCLIKLQPAKKTTGRLEGHSTVASREVPVLLAACILGGCGFVVFSCRIIFEDKYIILLV
jgi:hypothetical protein